jgi:protein-tyrosine-phosphatase
MYLQILQHVLHYLMTNILFLCPHNAAKSALAAAYAQTLAKQQGLNIMIDTAGTEPDAHVAVAVSNFLKQEGLAEATTPRKVTPQDIASANYIISMGCDLNDLPLQGKAVEQWNDVPPVSQDLLVAWQNIKDKVETLFSEIQHSNN